MTHHNQRRSGRTDWRERIEHEAKRFFDDARGCHDWDHTLRVHRLCKRIGAAEGADLQVLLVAALLHDIGRNHQDAGNGTLCHAEKGAQMALPVVQGTSLTRSQKDNIIHCIQAHRFRNDHEPGTIEAKVLYDADKLDAIGAVGVARAYLFAGEIGACLHNVNNKIENTQPYSPGDTGYREYRVKLCRIKDRMLTETGKQMAAERHDFMVSFFERFIEEYEGLK